ncbi:hypothetical protein JCM17380_39160 [Desulfosporosinus burensis]
MNIKQIIEEREETCPIVSKLVKPKIFRNRVEGGSKYKGEIVGFECGSSVQIVYQNVIIR